MNFLFKKTTFKSELTFTDTKAIEVPLEGGHDTLHSGPGIAQLPDGRGEQVEHRNLLHVVHLGWGSPGQQLGNIQDFPQLWIISHIPVLKYMIDTISCQ